MIVHIQQAANEAINGAIGSSGCEAPLASKKRKMRDYFRGVAAKDQSLQMTAEPQQVLRLRILLYESFLLIENSESVDQKGFLSL